MWKLTTDSVNHRPYFILSTKKILHKYVKRTLWLLRTCPNEYLQYFFSYGGIWNGKTLTTGQTVDGGLLHMIGQCNYGFNGILFNCSIYEIHLETKYNRYCCNAN